MRALLISLVTVAAAASCTKQNPNFCCTDEANCQSLGLSTTALCSDGLVCRGNQCIAENCTSSADCDGSLPFCAATGTCAATCDQDTECPGQGGNASDMYCGSAGACVQCRTSSDCAGAAPVCAGGACRGCEADAECASTICGSAGACVASADIVYLSATGLDSGTCTQDAPCRGLTYAAAQTSVSRAYVSMAIGDYTSSHIALMSTAPVLDIHGNHATLTASPSSTTFFQAESPIVLRDLMIDDSAGTEGDALSTLQASLYDVTINCGSGGAYGLGTAGVVDAHDLIVENAMTGILAEAAFTLDRGIVHDCPTGVRGGGSFQISNLMLYNASTIGLDFSSSDSVMMSFSTIVSAGAQGAVDCSGGDYLADSIVWATSGKAGVSVDCTLQSGMIVGPTTVTGALDVDPQFVNAAAGDYHITATSPAVDMANSGPAYDFEGDARPQGARYDIGADEYKP